MKNIIKNRGTNSNTAGRFEKETREVFFDGWDRADEAEDLPTLETLLLIEKAKSIITRNDSPDISFDQSINPYRRCEHGCIYCYARPSHAYMNLSPGLDFETKIFYKEHAATLFEKEINQPTARLRVIRTLSELRIPITAMAAPMIPIINDMELEHILKSAAEAGALNVGYTLIRLPYEVKDLFKEWLTTYYPECANHVIHLIQQMRGGKDYDATFGKRMKGEGQFAALLTKRFKLACKKFNLNQAPF